MNLTAMNLQINEIVIWSTRIPGSGILPTKILCTVSILRYVVVQSTLLIQLIYSINRGQNLHLTNSDFVQEFSAFALRQSCVNEFSIQTFDVSKDE